jgi:PAS domain S-box-containing protein
VKDDEVAAPSDYNSRPAPQIWDHYMTADNTDDGLAEEKFRLAVEACPNGMVMIDGDGKMVMVNAEIELQFNYPRAELIGQPVDMLVPMRLRGNDTHTTGAFNRALEAADLQVRPDLFGVRKDGSEFAIEVRLTQIRTGKGPALALGVIVDISARKAAEMHLAQMESKYRGLLEAAPDAMVVVNQTGEIVLLNVQAEKQFGYRRDELLGQNVANIIPEGFAERLIADDRRTAAEALAQRIGTGIELTGRRKDGSEFPIELMLSPLESAEGILVTAAIRNISTRKAAEKHLAQTEDAETRLAQKVKELNRSNEELEQFAYIASHDLQEPLRMVASYTQLLSRRYAGKLDANADEFIAFAVDGASRMQRLIQDLLAYSRVGIRGSALLDTSSEEALRQALMNLHGAIDASGALVTHDPLPTVLADEGQLVQLLQNLVGNAIKYQSPGAGIPRVHISAAKNSQKKWVFSVQDNGLGIDPRYSERIFGMFQRLHKREEFGGTGIGLAICKKIVERHGGNISVESQLGHGSTFRFALAGN